MKRRLDIQIKNPCRENWDTFDKKGNVGFCKYCQQSVVDFTAKTDKEIFEYFSSNFGKVCGRFNAQQLRSYYSKEEKFGFSKAAVLTAGLLTLTPISESLGNNTGSGILTEQNNLNENKPSLLSNKNSLSLEKIRIYGTVISEEDESKLPGVNVKIKGTKLGTVTDIDGNFELYYNGAEGDEITLIFSFIGLKTVEKQVLVVRDKSELSVTRLSLDVMVLGEVCTVRRWSPRGIWWRIKSVFHRH